MVSSFELTVFLALWGSSSVKAQWKMLVKLTPWRFVIHIVTLNDFIVEQNDDDLSVDKNDFQDSLSLFLSPSFAHTYTHTYTHTHTHTHTYTHTHIHTHTHTYTHSHTHKDTHSHTLLLSLALSNSLCSLFLSISHCISSFSFLFVSKLCRVWKRG